MKTLFSILSVFIFSFSSFAFPFQSRLSVSTSDNSFLRIIIDDRYDRQGSSILIDELLTGYHSIKIYQAENGGWNNRRIDFDLVYSGIIHFKPMHHIDIVLSRFGKVVINERQMDRRYDGNGSDRRDDDFSRRSNRRDGNYDLYYRTMSNDMFRAARGAIRNERFDQSRINMAKQIIGSNYLSANQVKELVELFSFEDNKLEIAKYAFARTVDKNAYFILYDAFSFSSTKEALAVYIQNFR